MMSSDGEMDVSEGSDNSAVRSDPASFFHSPIVTINVGKDEKPFFVHKALLVAYSPYFKACLKPVFGEGQDLVVNMPEEDCEAFEAFLAWLYTGSLTGPLMPDASPNNTIEVYALADKLLVPDLKNRVVDLDRHHMRDKNLFPCSSSIAELEQYGLLGSKYALFHLRYFAFGISTHPTSWTLNTNGQGSEHAIDDLDTFFKNEKAVTEAFRYIIKYNIEKWPNPLLADDCDFHEHDETTQCKGKPTIKASASLNTLR